MANDRTMDNINREIKGCFDFFWRTMSLNEASYGLIPDRYPDNANISSIASTGFGVAALTIGAQRGLVAKKQVKDRINGLLNTLVTIERDNGFYYHFYTIDEGKRFNKCEISTIDTALLVAGLIVAGEYFGGQIKVKVNNIYKDINWKYFVDERHCYFAMAKYDSGITGHWDAYAEQLLMYIFSASCPNKEFAVDKKLYYSMKRFGGCYKDIPFVYTWYGALFTHQFSQAFIDFRGTRDAFGMDWFDNSTKASVASWQYSRDNVSASKTYGDNSWGLTACDTPTGYSGRLGTPPTGVPDKCEHILDGTVCLAGAIGSTPFTPQQSLAALNHYYSVDKLVGEFGLVDSYNLDVDWYCQQYIGIDKGISICMLSNYLDGFVWDCFMKNKYIISGLKVLQFEFTQRR